MKYPKSMVVDDEFFNDLSQLILLSDISLFTN